MDPGSVSAPAAVGERFERLTTAALRGVDVASMAVFRIAFGLLMVWEAYRYLDKGWVAALWADPTYRFTFRGFAWVPVAPEPVLTVLVVVVGVLGASIAVGVATRVSAGLLAVVFSYLFLLEATNYLNHFWLTVLLAGLLAVVATDGRWSWRARRHGAVEQVPAWHLWVLRGQMTVVYVVAGIAKVQGDWLTGWPMRHWVPGSLQLPGLRQLADEAWLAVALSWGGMLFDLAIVPLLLWRRTRPFALLAAIAFHALNRELFGIGIFPYLGVAATLLFLDPGWPRTVVGRLRRLVPGWSAATASPTAGATAGRALAATDRTERTDREAQPAVHPGVGRAPRRTVQVVVAVWVVVMLVLPVRPFVYAGEPMWTEEGMRLSWHMLLRSKVGELDYIVERDGQPPERVDPREHLTSRQYRKVAAYPELIRQHAHHLADERDGEVRVRAIARASLHGRPMQELIDPQVDLAAEPPRLPPADWIVPLESQPCGLIDQDPCRDTGRPWRPVGR